MDFKDQLPRPVRYVTQHALDGYRRVGKNRRKNNGEDPVAYLRLVAENGTMCGTQTIGNDKITGRLAVTYHVRDNDTIVVCCAPINQDRSLGKAVVITAYGTQTYFHGVAVGTKKGDLNGPVDAASQ